MTVAIEVALEDQDPPGDNELKAVVAPSQTIGVPVNAAGALFTVIDDVAIGKLEHPILDVTDKLYCPVANEELGTKECVFAVVVAI